MALFEKKNRHPIIEVIEYGGIDNRNNGNAGPKSNAVLVWKHPSEDFNTNAKLRVGSSQEVLFVKGGQILQKFVSGTYTLDTQNYPFIRALVGKLTNGVSPFSCIIYYINKSVSMGIDWGTNSPIRLTDPIYHIPIDLRSYGDLSIQVENGQMLFEKLVGVTEGFTQADITNHFTNMMATQIRSVISNYMIQHQLTPIGIDAHLPAMSEEAEQRVRELFVPYGMRVVHFAIASITYTGLEAIEKQLAQETTENIKFEHEINRHRINSSVEAEDALKKGQATAQVNEMLGFSAKEQAIADIGLSLSKNIGPVTGSGGIAMPGGIVAGMPAEPAAKGVADIVKTLAASNAQPVREQDDSFKDKVDKLRYMHEAGLLSDEEFSEAKSKLMDQLFGK